MTCRHCGRETPEGTYCTWCGASQAPGSGPASTRGFAAAPGESRVSANVLSTLLPHLNRQGMREYRWALGIGLAVLVGLYLVGLITAAFVVAAILVPTVYVMYLYEARVYRDAPIPVMLATIGGGIVVGIVATVAVDAVLGSRPIWVDGLQGPTINVPALLLATVFIPLIIQMLKPLPALVLRSRPQFVQSIDGVVFGVAAGLGFAAAETLLHYSSVITRFPVRSEPGMWILPLLSVGILVPLLHGTTTGLVTGSIWRLGRRPLGRLATGSIVAALAGHVAFALGTQLIIAVGVHGVVALVWQTIVVLALVLAMRLLLNDSLRDEAAEMGLRQIVCANCGASGVAGGFCPACGVAVSATASQTTVVPATATSGQVAGGAR
jgi:RsiW-degrading membrane proteinase PrsW (M82 family)